MQDLINEKEDLTKTYSNVENKLSKIEMDRE